MLPDPDRLGTIGQLALPICGGMVSQNIFNLVDTAMVGSLGDAALAGVGTGSFANFLAMSFVMGMGAGVQAMSARRLGQGRDDVLALPLNGGLLLVVLLAVPTTALLYAAAPRLLPLLVPTPEVLVVGVPYLQIRLISMVGVGVNFAFRGYWNGVNLSRLYLKTLLTIHATNLVLNYAFIFGKLGAPELGAVGAAVASVLATYVGTAVYIGLGLRHALPGGFLRGLPGRDLLGTLLRLSIPAGTQQTAMAAGYVALLWIVAQVGTRELAATHVMISFMLVGILPAIGLGLSAASLVGQALGRGDERDAKRWGWDVVRVGILATTALGLAMWLVPSWILAPFLHDPITLALAELPVRVMGLGMCLDGVGLVLLQAHLGAGAARTVFVVSAALQWGIGLTASWLLGPVAGLGLLGIWVGQVFYRTLQAGVLSWLWRRGAWARTEL